MSFLSSKLLLAGDWAETQYQVIDAESKERGGRALLNMKLIELLLQLEVLRTPTRLAEGDTACWPRSMAWSVYYTEACDITSGRTHQIRVHMQHLGHPLVSDDKYASEKLDQVRETRSRFSVGKDRLWCPRLFLHCYRLQFKDVRTWSLMLPYGLIESSSESLALLEVND